MKTIYYAATTLNGFIADKNNSLEWLFQFQKLGESVDSGGGGPADFDKFMSGIGSIAMGSTTYEWIYEHQIANKPGELQPWPYKVPTWVFTTRKLPIIPNADVRFVKGDVKPVHKEMAAVDPKKNVWIMGGGELAAKFYDAGLLNEMILQIAPVTVDGGAPLFPRKIHPPMKLLATKPYEGLFVELTYEIPAPQKV